MPPAPFYVLCVDRDEQRQKLLSAFLSTHNSRADWAGSFTEAMKKVEEERFQLLLLASSAVGQSTLQLTKRFRELNRSSPIILISDNRKEETKGLSDFTIVDPPDFYLIIKSVSEVLNRETD
jgi:DNA-binding response OmpR family regulator